MSLALATKGVLCDYVPTGTGTGETIYVLENFNVEVSHDNLDIVVTMLDSLTIDTSDVEMVLIDLDSDQAVVVGILEETFNIEV
jgi:hypothetical protein